jgi:glycosyltransferase involved in cell wall biosynthesis
MGAEGAGFPLRLAIQQRVMPDYRVAFFDLLAQRFAGGVSVFAGQPLPEEGIVVSTQLAAAGFAPARNHHFRQPDSAFYLCWQRGLVAWLMRWQPDVLVVEANPRLRSTPQAVRWMHARGKPVLGWGLGVPPLDDPTLADPTARHPQLGRLLARLRAGQRDRFLRSLDGWIAYSRRGAAEYLSLGLDPERIFVAGNAVSPRPSDPPPARPDFAPDRPLVLSVGRLQARKRVDNLLRACASLPADLQPRLVIVGDGPARGELESLARQVYPAAEFTGAQRGSDLESYFLSADLFVLPGTGGLAVQQAMRYALPVIVARGDGTQEDLVRPENGWLIPPDDLPALVSALGQAFADPARLRRMGLESYRIVAQEVNLERMADVFFQAAQTVMG